VLQADVDMVVVLMIESVVVAKTPSWDESDAKDS
jgi:hypothetical protein